MKNSTPQQIATLIALLTTIGGATVFTIFYFIDQSTAASWYWFLFPILLYVLCFFVTLFYLKKYIYRKIKLIYKAIHQHKVSPAAKKSSINVNTNILEEVQKEVQEWAALQVAEVAKYKSWAEYRRRFVGDISHELKTPIFNIQGYLHSLLDGGLEDEKVNIKFLKKASKNVDRLQTIIEDLTAISRLETGTLILDKEPFDIKQLVLDIFEDMELKASEQNIKLEFKAGADHSYKVRADRESIRQVLTNLIENSIKYGKDEGVTKVSFYDMDNNILIEIADDGIGIPKSHLPHVFDRFYRVDKSRSRKKGGSGLGLSIVKHIIEAHEQAINARSTQDVGSTFGFTLEKA